jgi:RHS repeat-associated protein
VLARLFRLTVSIPLGFVAAALPLALIVLPRPAMAQNPCEMDDPPPPPECYSVSVTPKGGMEPMRPANSGGHSASFTVLNTGNPDTYTIDCFGSANVTCTGWSPAAVSGGATVTVFYSVGGGGVGTLTICATGTFASDCGWYDVPVQSFGVSVTPDGGPSGTAPTRVPNTGGHTAVFSVQNTGSGPETWTLACTGSANVTCGAVGPLSITLASGLSGNVTVSYAVAAAGTGTLTLTATGTQSNNSGFFTVPVGQAAGAPIVDVTPYNFDKQDYGRCAFACFAAVYAQSTVPYFSLDASRGVTLVYNGDRVAPRPFVHVNVTPDLSTGTPTEYRLQLRVAPDNVNFVNVTFLNGEQVLRFAYPGNINVRLGGQFDAGANNVGSTGVYPLEILVSALHTGGPVTTTIPTKLVVVNEVDAAIARGWTLAGISRLHQQADGSALVTQGDGSAVYFWNVGGTFVAPPGEFSSLTGGGGWTRSYLDSTKIVFNSQGRMIQARDRFSNVTTIVYDGGNRVSKVRDPINLPITLTYGANGLSAIQDTMGRVTTVTVDASRRLTAITDPDNVSTTFGYDASLRLSTITNRRGHTTTLGYDAPSGKLATITAPAISYVGANGADSTGSPLTGLASWHKMGVPYGSTSPAVAAPKADTVYGRLTDPGGHVTRFTVNRWGSPVQMTDVLGRTTTVTYEARGLPIRTVHPTGVKDTTGYNANGLPIHVRPAGRDSATYIRYAAWAQPDSIWGFQVPPVRNFIGGSGRVDSTRTWGPSGARVTRFVYDSRGRIERTTDPEGHLTGRAWYVGTNGNRSKDSLPGGRVTTYISDAYGRSTNVAAPGLAARGTAYDVLNRTTRDSGAGLVTVYGYDSLYLKSLADPRGQVYGFAYNALGWTTARTDPAGHADTLRYDREGLLRRWKNRRFETIRYSYDAGHRSTGTGGTNTDSTTWTYSTDGRVVGASSPWAVDTAFLDSAGIQDSLRTRFGGQAFTQRLSYTIGARLDSVTVSGGGITFLSRKYRWNSQSGELDTIRLGGGGSTGLVENRDGRSTNVALPGGDSWARAYTSVHDEATISTTASYAQAVSRYLGFDAAQRIVRQIFGDGLTGQAFGYDALGRLIADTAIAWVDTSSAGNPCTGNPPPDVDENGNLCSEGTQGGYWSGDAENTHLYSYDAVGNRLDQSGSYGTGNRIRQFAGCTYVTDSLGDGNVLSRLCGTETVHFHWSAESRLKAVKVVGGDSVDFRYDAIGRLVRKDVNGAVQTWFLWQGDNLLAELTAGATGKVAEYSYFPGLDNPHAVITGTTPYFAHVDGIQNVIALTDSATKTVQRSYEYDPWGALTGGSDVKPFTDADRARFKGALWLGPQVDVYYMRARWYEPKSGRFLSEDPIGLAGGINPYTFVNNDPINRRDPTGTCDEDEELWVIFYDNDKNGQFSPGDTVVGYYCKNVGGGSGGNAGPGQQDQQLPPDRCPLPPVGPPGADVNANISVAEAHNDPERYGLDWFESMVDYGKPWDYKTSGIQYEAFGNFNYGATGRAAGIGPGLLYRAAGYAQVRHGGASAMSAFRTAFLGGYPYGDDPRDQANIRAGQQYYQNGCQGGGQP